MATGQYTQFPIDWKSLDASQVPYSNATSGLSATDVQGAIDELNTDLNAIDASDIPYDNTASGLTADDVQEALDELDVEKQDVLTAGDGITISSDTISTDNDATLTSAVKPAQAKAVGDALSAQETATEEALYTKAPVIVDTASGSIASFPDGADSYPLKECVIQIDAVQDGTGDPSPTNVRPISGWSSAKVTRTGKNLLDPAKRTSDNNGNKQRWYYNDGFILKANQAYTLSVTYPNPIALYIKDKVSGNDITTGNSPLTVTVAQDTLIYVQAYRAEDISALDTFQLELGSSASDYEPYQGNTYTISLGDTRYGAMLDVTRGKLIDKKYDFTVSSGISISEVTQSASGAWAYIELANNNIPSAKVKADSVEIIASSALGISYDDRTNYATNRRVYIDGSGRPVLRSASSDTVSSKADLLALFDGCQLVYELATPIEVDLTPTEVTTLLGINNVWADCGDIEVEYCADTKKYIQKLISQLA